MKKIHFIAIGGSVMHQLAIALSRKGYEVTGSDDEVYEPARTNLEKEGILPEAGWDPSRITPELDAVLLGMHARADNPELLRAIRLGIPVYSFPEFIYRESISKTRVVIGGSHGKTTITSMILHVLGQSTLDFDYLVGAKLPGFPYSVKLSEAPLIVCEGDEYPASAVEKIPKFLFYHPQLAVLSGIAWDHINVFPTFEIYLEQFARFIREMEAGATLIYQSEDPELVKLIARHGTHLRLLPYGLPDHEIRDGHTIVRFQNLEATLEVFGAHNLRNLAAARLVCGELGISDGVFLEAVSSFKGASRRLEKVFEKPGAALFRDFAHAPSKVRATLEAVREQFPSRKLAAVFELHTFSSLNAAFLSQYAHALDLADTAMVFYSSHALEAKRLPALSAEIIRKGFARKDLAVTDQVEALYAFLGHQPSGEANLLMMSSGNFAETPLEKIISLWQKT